MIKVYKNRGRTIVEFDRGQPLGEMGEELIAILACFEKLAKKELGGCEKEYMEGLLKTSFKIDGLSESESEMVMQ